MLEKPFHSPFSGFHYVMFGVEARGPMLVRFELSFWFQPLKTGVKHDKRY